MKRTTIVVIVMSLLVAILPVGLALAATSQDVEVTATPSFTGISNSPGIYDFGTVSANSTPNTGTDYFTITNTSSANISISINCTDWTGGTGWTYGAPDEDTANLAASSGNSTGGGSSGVGTYDIDVPVGTGALLIKAVPAGVNPNWELQLNAPTSLTFGDEQTTTVTITATTD